MTSFGIFVVTCRVTNLRPELVDMLLWNKLNFQYNTHMGGGLDVTPLSHLGPPPPLKVCQRGGCSPGEDDIVLAVQWTAVLVFSEKCPPAAVSVRTVV